MTVNLGTRATYSHDPTTGTRQTGMNGCLFGRTRRSCVCVFKAPRSRSRSRSALVTPRESRSRLTDTSP